MYSHTTGLYMNQAGSFLGVALNKMCSSKWICAVMKFASEMTYIVSGVKLYSLTHAVMKSNFCAVKMFILCQRKHDFQLRAALNVRRNGNGGMVVQFKKILEVPLSLKKF